MDPNQIGMQIRSCRQRRGLTQEQLAARAGLSYSTVGRIERGQQNLSIGTLLLILQALGTTLQLTIE